MSMDLEDQIGVLFVCTGNICRSPLAEWLFRHRAEKRGVIELFRVESCGTGDWHEGEEADPRTALIAAKHGVRRRHTARALSEPHDIASFEWLIAMDRTHKRHLLKVGAHPGNVHLVRAFDPSLRGAPEEALDVPDPYYGGPEGFQQVYDMLAASCEGLLEHVLRLRSP